MKFNFAIFDVGVTALLTVQDDDGISDIHVALSQALFRKMGVRIFRKFQRFLFYFGSFQNTIAICDNIFNEQALVIWLVVTLD